MNMPIIYETRPVKAADAAAGEYVSCGELGSLQIKNAEFNGKTVTLRLKSDDGFTEVTMTRNPGDQVRVELR
jgi:hypothetical protein